MLSKMTSAKLSNTSDNDEENSPPNLDIVDHVNSTINFIGSTTDKKKRRQFLDTLSTVLTVHEAASLVALIHNKKSNISKGQRFGLYPITDWPGFIRAKQMEASLWPAEEVEFHKDRNDFNELTKDEQRPLKMAFGFFAVGDGSVVSMLAYQMVLVADSLEKQNGYIVQMDNERTHAETYGKMIFTLIPDKKERENIFNAVENVKSIKAMNTFIEDSYMFPDGERQLLVCLVAAEFLMFTPLFCIIFWYRAYKRGKLKAVIFSNEKIAEDECNHGENGCCNYRELPKEKRYADKEIWTIINKVVGLVDDFADEVLSDISLAELTPKNMKQYIRYVADDVLDRLDHAKYYNVSSPFVWMNFTKLVPKTNFYSGTVGQYARFNLKQSIENAMKLCKGEVEDEKTNIYKRVDKVKF